MPTVEIIKKLSADLQPEAIQKTNKKDTKKGYDTTGYGYQFCVDRFNEVLGLKWGFEYEIIKEKEGKYKSGTPYIEITAKITIWVNDKENGRTCIGGHTAINYADAMKGAITNGFKKTAAFWGVGAKAFRGMIDDDHSIPEHDNQKQKPEKQKSYATSKKEPAGELKRKMLLLQIKDVIKSGSFTEKEIAAARLDVEKAKTNKDLNAILVFFQSELNKRIAKKDKTGKDEFVAQTAKIFEGETIENFKDDTPGEAEENELDIF